MVLNQGRCWLPPPQGRQFRLSTGRGCYWHPMSRSRRSCSTPHSAQDNPATQHDPAQMSVVTRLKNPALDLGPGGSHHVLNSPADSHAQPELSSASPTRSYTENPLDSLLRCRFGFNRSRVGAGLGSAFLTSSQGCYHSQ